jgi:ribosomal protein L9
MDIPKEVREYLVESGRRGGKKKVPKGFARMSPQKLKKVTRQGNKASVRARKAKARNERRRKTNGGTDSVPPTSGE